MATANRFQREKKIIKSLSKDSNTFIDNLLTDKLGGYTGGEVQIYPNLIHMLIDNNDQYNPINTVVKKPDYFKALEEYHNYNFQSLSKSKPSKAIMNFNRKFINNDFIYRDKVIVNKAINKYFHKKITAKVVIFLVDISFIEFNRLGRIKTIPGHRAFLLYNTETSNGVYVDPGHIATQELISYDTYKDALLGKKRQQFIKGSEDFESIVVNKLNRIIPNIVKNSTNIRYINYICPQALTDDKNCVFWSLFLIEKFVEEYAQDSMIEIESVMYNLLSENPSKEDLENLIEKYKNKLAITYKFKIYNRY